MGPGYTYSVFSLAAIAIHLITNFDFFTGRGSSAVRDKRYRGFLLGVLAYYITDAAWGIFTELGGGWWAKLLYVDTAFYFLAFVAFILTWCRFITAYLDLGKWPSRILIWSGYALLVFNIAALAINPFYKCFFYLDKLDKYQRGDLCDPAFYLLVAYTALMAAFVLVKLLASRDDVRRRCMMIFMCCDTLGVSILLQVIQPFTPFTALGCLISNCFLHVFVIQDEQATINLKKLERALERARVAEKSRSMFFSIVSHDIRTPLNAILGYSELLQDGVRSQVEKDEALQSIRSSGTTLLQLVNDVLDLAKMDAGKMTLRPEPVRLSQLTDEVFASFRMVANGKEIELINRTEKVPTVLLDGHRFRQILFNLIGNAVKFTASGSIEVTASYAGTTLDVSVTDTGCGIAPDMLTRILDPFVQVDDPTHSADRANGTGLGLSICRRLIEVMGGELIVDSEPQKGSTFKIHIPGVPAGEKDSEPSDEPKPVAALKKLPKHVLVVDDSPVNRSVLTAFLKKAGVASIDHAGDGVEALAKLKSEIKTDAPYDFVFSDLWMPNMNGIEFVEKLRADYRFVRLPCFALTADTEFNRDPRTRFFSGVLLKPITYGKLLDMLATFKQ